MQKLASLEKALEITAEGIFLARNTGLQSTPPENPLFFPRKKLRMTKVYSGNWEPWSWFIQERLDERATSIQTPTPVSHEGLTSGFRSAIVKNPDGTYTKLKGVSLKPTVKLTVKEDAKGKVVSLTAKGLCAFSEACYEMENLQVLNCMTEDLTPGFPEFLEIYRYPQTSKDYAEFLEDFAKPPVRARCTPIKLKEWDKLNAEARRIEWQLFDSRNSRNQDYFVLGMKTNGDTRLDEACYHLTRKELKGGLKEKRDELLRYLFFRAGVLNGLLATRGFAWSSDLVYSNSHLGNFTLSSRKGMLDVRICDLGTARFRTRFKNTHEFIKFANQEVDNFKHEFEKTAGMTVQRKYEHFSKKLKGECLDALKTGYAMMMFDELKTYKDILMSYHAPRILVPDRAVIPVEEFKGLLAELKVA